jgi:hypothetical protein
MISALLTSITFILFGVNLAGFAPIPAILLGVLFIVTGIVILVENASVFRR